MGHYRRGACASLSTLYPTVTLFLCNPRVRCSQQTVAIFLVCLYYQPVVDWLADRNVDGAKASPRLEALLWGRGQHTGTDSLVMYDECRCWSMAPSLSSPWPLPTVTFGEILPGQPAVFPVASHQRETEPVNECDAPCALRLPLGI